MNSFLAIGKKYKLSFSNYLLIFVIAVLCLISISSIFASSVFENSTNKFLIQLLPFTLVLLVIFIIFRFTFSIPIRSLFTSNLQINTRKISFSFLLWFGILLVFFFLDFVLKPQQFLFQFDWKEFLYLFIITTIFVGFQTLFEEILFRSILIQGFALIFKNKFAIAIVISCLFTLLHFTNPEIAILGKISLLYYFLTSLFLTIITIEDNGIELAFGFHFANNFFGSLVLTNNWQVFQTKALFVDLGKAEINWQFWFILLILYPILFFFFIKWKKIELF